MPARCNADEPLVHEAEVLLPLMDQGLANTALRQLLEPENVAGVTVSVAAPFRSRRLKR